MWWTTCLEHLEGVLDTVAVMSSHLQWLIFGFKITWRLRPPRRPRQPPPTPCPAPFTLTLLVPVFVLFLSLLLTIYFINTKSSSSYFQAFEHAANGRTVMPSTHLPLPLPSGPRGPARSAFSGRPATSRRSSAPSPVQDWRPVAVQAVPAPG